MPNRNRPIGNVRLRVPFQHRWIDGHTLSLSARSESAAPFYGRSHPDLHVRYVPAQEKSNNLRSRTCKIHFSKICPACCHKVPSVDDSMLATRRSNRSTCRDASRTRGDCSTSSGLNPSLLNASREFIFVFCCPFCRRRAHAEGQRPALRGMVLRRDEKAFQRRQEDRCRLLSQMPGHRTEGFYRVPTGPVRVESARKIGMVNFRFFSASTDSPPCPWYWNCCKR